MLPERLIPANLVHGAIVPSYLAAVDLPWIRVLLDEIARFYERPTRELDERLSLPLPCFAPPFKLRATIHYLRALHEPEIVAALKPPVAREALFLAAADARDPGRDEIVARTAALHSISRLELEQAIVADLPGERLLRPPKRFPTPQEVIQSVNQLLVRSLIGRARVIRICAEGSMRGIVRQAKLVGLLCTLRDEPSSSASASLEISGPFSLFRHTLLYARALASLLGRLPYCAGWELFATCRLRGQDATFSLSARDSIFQIEPGTEPRAYDSKLEEQFAKAMRRAAPGWDLIREPEAIRAGDRLIFPDFALINRIDPSRRFLIEIVGFWTHEYITRKLADLRACGRRDLILCLDESLKCDDAALPDGMPVVRFRKRVRPEQVLAAIGVDTEATSRIPSLRTSKAKRASSQ